MMKKLMKNLIAFGAMLAFGLTGCSNLNDTESTVVRNEQSERCTVTVNAAAARAVIVAEYGESDINQRSLSATNVADATDTYTTGNKTSLSELSLTIVKDETYDFTLTGIVGTAEVPGAVKGEILARKITGNTRLCFTVKPSDATSTEDPNAKGMAELKFDITGMDVMEESMEGHGYKFVAKGHSGNAATKTENLELEYDELTKAFKAKNAVLPTGIWELTLLCDGTTYCEGIFFAVEAGLTTKVTVLKTNLTIPGTGEITGIYKDGIKNFTPAVPEDMLAANTKVQFEFDVSGFPCIVVFENDTDGTPVYKSCMQVGEDRTEDCRDIVSSEIDGDVYTFVMGIYSCIIDTANKTYTWLYKDNDGYFNDYGDFITNDHIYVNGADIIDDLDYVMPTPEDMLAPGAKVEINYILDPVNYKLSWQNDAEGNPINVYLQEFEADGSKGFGEECSGVFQNDEYIINLSWEYLRVNPKKKTYTFYIEDIRNPEDCGEDHTLTSIKINGVDITAEFEYETYVKPTAATMLEAGTTVRFSVNDSVYKYIVTFKNNASGMPVLQQILVSPPYPAADVTESDKNRFTASIQEGIYKYNHGDFELTIDTANATYTWCNNEADAKASIHDATIYVNNLDITDDLTYKAYVKPAVLEDILASNAKTEISFTMDSDNYKVTCINSANGNPGFPIDGGIIENGRDITTSAGNCDVDINDGKFVYTHFSTIKLSIDPENKTFKWYSTTGIPVVSNTTITINGTDFTEDLTEVIPSIKDMMDPNAKIEIRFKNDGTYYTAKWENDAEGNPSVTSFKMGSTDMTSAGSVYVYDSDYIFSFGLYALSINPQNKTYTWYSPTNQVDVLNEITNTTIIINDIRYTSDFTYKPYVQSN